MTCNPIWSWNINHHLTDVPVVEDLDDMCTAAGIDSGNTQHPCRFGFYPLGIFSVDTIDGITMTVDRQGTGADVYLVDEEPDTVRETDCNTDPQVISDSLDDGVYLSTMDWGTCARYYDGTPWDCEVFGDTAYKKEPYDTLWGFNWDTFKGLNESGNANERYDYTIRAEDFANIPTTFQATIESVQSSQFGFESECGC